mmetsp:Transcript_21056/g.50117  ORF Transcript_21056/g.50117 Transcript_21056/m.50117 type:complete len:207 (+) Transcript_21056:411-1031(+)
MSSMSPVGHHRPRSTTICLPAAWPSWSRKSVAPPRRHALPPKTLGSRPRADAAARMASRTSSVCTASAPFGPRKKGEEARSFSGTMCSRWHQRRRTAEYAHVGSPRGWSIGCFEAMGMGTRFILPKVSLMPRTLAVSSQCRRPVTLSRVVANPIDVGSSQTKWIQHSPSAGRNGSRGSLPGSPPRRRHWCMTSSSAQRTVGQPGEV